MAAVRDKADEDVGDNNTFLPSPLLAVDRYTTQVLLRSFKLEMISIKLHQIPEIIYRVEWFLPKELENLAGVQPTSRKDFIACVRINCLCHRTLTPLLWMVFDSKVAAGGQIPSSKTQLPLSILLLYIYDFPFQVSTQLASVSSTWVPWHPWRSSVWHA